MSEFNTQNLTKRGRGRPPGSRNKSTLAAKEMIQGVADRLGGLDRMVAWSQEDPLNERAFWQSIYPKLLPLTVSGDDKHPLSVIVRKVIDPVA